MSGAKLASAARSANVNVAGGCARPKRQVQNNVSIYSGAVVEDGRVLWARRAC
jgi:hypothetical protein